MAKDGLEAEFFYYETYFSIAHEAYSEAKKLEIERLAIQKPNPNAYDLVAEKNDAIERFTIVVTVLCFRCRSPHQRLWHHEFFEELFHKIF